MLAFLIAGVLNKIAGKIPFKIRKHYLAGIILLLFSIVFVVSFFALGTWVFQKCGDLAGHASALENDFYILLSDCCNRLKKGFGVNGPQDVVRCTVYHAIFERHNGYYAFLRVVFDELTQTVYGVGFPYQMVLCVD